MQVELIIWIIRCNQKFMFCNCKDRSIDFSVCLCTGYAWYVSSVILGISNLPPTGRKKVAFQHFNFHRILNFWCRREKIVYCVERAGSELFQSLVTHFAQHWNCLSALASHTTFLSQLCVHLSLKGSAGIYATTRLYYENNISWNKRFGFIYFKRHARML